MKTLIDLIRGFEHRDKDALIYKTGFRTLRYSYRSLYLKSLKTAALLKSLGLEKGDRVLIWAPNSPQWAMLFLGCILNGIVVVPLDVHSKPDFIRDIQNQVKARLIFQTRYKSKVLSVKTLLAEELEDSLDGQKLSKLPAVKESDWMQILYTSGTTSKPKGVIHTHKNIVSNIKSVSKVFPVDDSFRLLSVLPLSHVFEQTGGFWTALANGATIVYLRTLKPSSLLETIRKEQISTMLVVPSILSLFRSSIEQRFRSKNLLPALKALTGISELLPFSSRKFFSWPIYSKFGSQFRFFVVGGAPFSQEDEKFWNSLGFEALQGYGMTEASPVISLSTPREKKTGCVGRVLSGMTAKMGRDGELLFKGQNVTQGYFNDPENTRDLFEDGWLRTGDVGEIDSDGFLRLRGRKKYVIVTPSGLNVHAEDVEAALNQEPGIRESCVIGMNSEGGEQVHAVLLTRLDQGEAGGRVRSANLRLMPHQQISGFTVWPYDDFPRTPTMKIIKKNVIEVVSEKKTLARQSYGGKDRLYRLVARVARTDASEIRQSSVLSRDLKMDSISRIELVTLIETEFNIDVNESMINQKTTMRDLEKMISERKPSGTRHQRNWFGSGKARLLGAPVRALAYMLIRRYARLSFRGVERLPEKYAPAVFISNHTSNLDTPVVLMGLPKRYRDRIAVAAWGEWYKTDSSGGKMGFFKKTYRIFVMALRNFLFNTYSFDRTENSLQSLQYTGELIDRGYSILLFPEGDISRTGRMLSFESGIGILAQELHVSVIPMRLRGLHEILPPMKAWPVSKGQASLSVGGPVPYESLKNRSVVEIAGFLEEEVKKL